MAEGKALTRRVLNFVVYAVSVRTADSMIPRNAVTSRGFDRYPRGSNSLALRIAMSSVLAVMKMTGAGAVVANLLGGLDSIGIAV